MAGRLTSASRFAPILAALLLASCAKGQAPVPDATASRSVLVGSVPAAGASVAAPVNTLVLNFSPPARLDEVTVTGPEGKMPMMVDAAGETNHYSIPLPGLGPGTYTVGWRASVAGTPYSGTFGFAVH